MPTKLAPGNTRRGSHACTAGSVAASPGKKKGKKKKEEKQDEFCRTPLLQCLDDDGLPSAEVPGFVTALPHAHEKVGRREDMGGAGGGNKSPLARLAGNAPRAPHRFRVAVCLSSAFAVPSSRGARRWCALARSCNCAIGALWCAVGAPTGLDRVIRICYRGMYPCIGEMSPCIGECMDPIL